jgi:hypothetical protein
MLLRLTLTVSLVALALVAAAAPPLPARAGDSATVRGVVYWDRDADGEQDADEPGIATNPVLVAADDTDPLVTGFANDDGAFEMTAPPGTYRLSDGLARSFEECFGAPMPSYNPWGFRDCAGAEYPITSDRFTDAFDIDAGETIDIDLPVTTRDEMIILGRALDDGGNVSAGSVITAVNGDVECGSATVEEGGSPGGGPGDWELRALGAGQRDGCYEPGQNVTFMLGGREAGEAWSYQRFSPVPTQNGEYGREGITTVDIEFLEDYAWVWADYLLDPAGAPYPPGTSVRAIVAGIVCGETAIGDDQMERDGVTGFGHLLVASAALQPGCGQFGAPFDIVVGDAVTPHHLPWDNVVYQIGSVFLPPPTEPSSPPPVTYCYPTDVSPVSPYWPLSPPSDWLSPPPAPDSPPSEPIVQQQPAQFALLQEAPQSPQPASPPPVDLPLSPPDLSPPTSPPSFPVGCLPVPLGLVNGPDTGMGPQPSGDHTWLAWVALTMLAAGTTLSATAMRPCRARR